MLCAGLQRALPPQASVILRSGLIGVLVSHTVCARLLGSPLSVALAIAQLAESSTGCGFPVSLSLQAWMTLYTQGLEEA